MDNAFIIVPVPSVKPGTPYSICQFEAPPVIQFNVTDVVVLAVLAIAVGLKQVGALSIAMSSMAQSDCVELKPEAVTLEAVNLNFIVSPT